MTLLKARIKNNTFIKPTVAQSSAIRESPYASLMKALKKGDEFIVYEDVLEAAHRYVVLEKDGEFYSGFVFGPDIEIIPNPSSNEKIMPLSVIVAEPPKPVRNWESYKHPEPIEYPSDWSLSMDFPSRIIRYMMSQNWRIADGLRERNIVYFEGANLNGIPNANRLDEWNDFRCLISFDPKSGKKVPYFAMSPQVATTEPGRHYTVNPMNPNGAFRIALGQHQDAWVHGTHGHDAHPALVQVGMLGHYRDLNKDGSRAGDKFFRSDDNYVNQHWSYTGPSSVGRSSAGCLVGLDHGRHIQFIDLLRKDPRYMANRWFRYDTTIIDAADFARSQWGYK